jgi:hypothetical protein
MAGYIGSKVAVVSSGAERKKVFTATSGQTSFTGLSYTVNNVHVFQNGVRLVDGTDYTATNGNSITLTVGAATDDQVVVVSYNTFQTSDTVSASTGGTFSNPVTIDADGSTVLTVDRATSDGAIIDLQKSGSSVGSIGADGSAPYFATAVGATLVGIKMQGGNTPRVSPTDGSGDVTDGVATIGFTTSRFKDLYLSGGVVFSDAGGSGTSTSNSLDSYEEGTWQPVAADNSSGGNTVTTGQGVYTKIGRLVIATCDITNINTTGLTSTNPFYIRGLPFTNNGVVRSTSTLQVNLVNKGDGLFAHLSENQAVFTFKYNDDSKSNSATGLLVSDINDDQADMFGITLVYHTST